MDILTRIRRAALRGALRFTQKAREEMRLDHLEPADIRESLVAATRVTKVLRSHDDLVRRGDKLYVVKSRNFSGTPIYTKGTFRREEATDVFYILISAKISTD